jgi:hypothetical protein
MTSYKVMEHNLHLPKKIQNSSRTILGLPSYTLTHASLPLQRTAMIIQLRILYFLRFVKLSAMLRWKRIHSLTYPLHNKNIADNAQVGIPISTSSTTAEGALYSSEVWFFLCVLTRRKHCAVYCTQILDLNYSQPISRTISRNRYIHTRTQNHCTAAFLSLQ